MIENIIDNNGFNIALSGIFIVFLGLVLIAATIHLFNQFFKRRQLKAKQSMPAKRIKPTFIEEKYDTPAEIPDNDLAALGTAIELYRRIHFDQLQSAITFSKGRARNVWKIGTKFGQRHPRAR